MQKLTVTTHSALIGTLNIPGDKSITHRAMIIGALFNRNTRIILKNYLPSLDCIATLNILQAMGLVVRFYDENRVEFVSLGKHGLEEPTVCLDVGNSGTTIRLLAGVLAAQKFSSTITGDASLCRRPMKRVIDPLTLMGAKIFASDGRAPLKVMGGQKLTSINYQMPIASAQVKSAILLADLYTDGCSNIHVPSVCRDHTELMLEYFSNVGSKDVVNLDIPADLSSAAFFIVAATIVPKSDLVLPNIGLNPSRTAIITILQQMGADIECSNFRTVNNEFRGDLRVRYAAKLNAITVAKDLIANAIDEIPILCLAAACAQGTTVIRGATELRYKESDRITMLAQGFRQLGIEVLVFPDGLAITGATLSGGIIDSDGDHRIAMTFLIAGLVAKQKIIVQDTQNIASSFPNFSDVAANVGMNINEAE